MSQKSPSFAPINYQSPMQAFIDHPGPVQRESPAPFLDHPGPAQREPTPPVFVHPQPPPMFQQRFNKFAYDPNGGEDNPYLGRMNS